MYANASGAKIRSKIGLGKVCEILKLEWDSKFGEQHNALADAYLFCESLKASQLSAHCSHI
jgi:hypothetical protein